MSILSDKEIKQLCEVNTFVFINGKDTIYFNEDSYIQKLEKFFDITIDADYVKKTMDTLAPGNHVDFFTSGIIIKKLVEPTKPMISPFVDRQVKLDDKGNKLISYGLSSSGYDVRLIEEFKIFNNLNSSIIDPLDFDNRCLYDHEGPYCIVPPNSYILGRTVEYFDIPRDIMVVCVGKSTYARCGAIVNVTPIEPEFKGNIVIEISNSTTLPLKIYANQGIAQFLFFKMTSSCEVSYADRSGKYQNQTTIKTAIG